ncbi:MAG: hypothetical protein ACSHX0_09570 [Akkermansiaceae bacterium]
MNTRALLFALPVIMLISLLGMNILHADILKLDHPNTLSGKIQSINNGIITLHSDLANEPLEIKQDAMTALIIRDQSRSTQKEKERLTLTNGDNLTCTIVSIDDASVEFSSWYAGTQRVSRADIDSIQFGISDEPIIYIGGNDITSWENSQGEWLVPDSHSPNLNKYQSIGTSSISKNLNLSDNIHINFDLSWEKLINYKFIFCASTTSLDDYQDKYQFSFNNNHAEITRHFADKTLPIVELIYHKAPLQSIDNNTVNIDIQLNRIKRELTLKINDVHLGSIYDFHEAPRGNYITLHNKNTNLTSTSLSNLVVTELPIITRLSAGLIQNSETQDILIDSEAEELHGSITSIKNISAADKRVLYFELGTPDETTDLTIPEHRLSTLYFAQQQASGVENNEDVEKTNDRSPYRVILHDGGSLQLDKLEFIDTQLIAHSPLIGRCKIDLSAVSQVIKNSQDDSK